MNYFYFAASLPSFVLGDTPPFSAAEFRARCAEHLSPADLRAIDELESPLHEPATNAFVAQCRESEIELRNALARLRAAHRHEDPGRHLRHQADVDMRVEHAASDAFSKGSPVERELALDRFRWRRIDELAGLDAFAGTAILAYALKLTLAQRWSSLDEEAGTARAAKLTKQEKP